MNLANSGVFYLIFLMEGVSELWQTKKKLVME